MDVNALLAQIDRYHTTKTTKTEMQRRVTKGELYSEGEHEHRRRALASGMTKVESTGRPRVSKGREFQYFSLKLYLQANEEGLDKVWSTQMCQCLSVRKGSKKIPGG